MNSDGSLSLFNGSNLVITKKLDDCVTVATYYNGEVIAAASEGKVTILNEDLDIIKDFSGRKSPNSIFASDSILAIGHWDEISRGTVQSYKTNNLTKHKVVHFQKLFTLNF